MFKILLVLSLFLQSALVAGAESNKQNIIVLGDSISAAYGLDISAGWVHLLKEKIAQEKKDYQVINASISGDTTGNGLKRLPGLLDEYKPEIVIIELGGNDGLRGLSLKMIYQNLDEMISMSEKQNARVLLAGMRIPPNYGRRYTNAFYNIYQELEQNNKLILVPFILDGVGGNNELMQGDGIHPTAEAQSIILNNIWTKLGAML